MGCYHHRHRSGGGIEETYLALVYHLVGHVPVEEHYIGKVPSEGYLAGEVLSPPLMINPIELQALLRLSR